MRITFTIVAAGDRWTFQLPQLPKLTDLMQGGEYDREATCRFFGTLPNVTASSRDTDLTLAVALSFLDILKQWQDENCTERDAQGIASTLHVLKRRANQGRVTKARVTFSPVNGGGTIRADVQCANIAGTIQADEYERLFAHLAADILEETRKKYVADGRGDLLQLSDATKLLVAEVNRKRAAYERREAIRKANENRLICERYRKGYCAPCKFDCPNYKNGRCVELPMPQSGEGVGE